MAKFYYIIILIIIFSSCQKKQVLSNIKKNNIEISDIWVIDSLNNQVDKLLLSDVAKDIEIIPLEFNKNHTFKIIDNIVVDNNNIFLNTRASLLRYNKEGKFINQIGSDGEGPTEFSICHGMGIDEEKHLIYVANALGDYNEIKIYTYDDEFIKSIHIAERGKHMYGSTHKETRGYNFFNNKYIFRRLLPTSDNSKDIWQIQMQDINGNILATFYDPAILNYIQNNYAGVLENAKSNQWYSSSPVQNRYQDNINFMFDSNDTIYQYFETKNSLEPRFILHCGKRPSFEEIRKISKESEYFKYTFVTDVLEAKDFLYLVAVKDRFAYLLRVDKKTGAIQTIKEEGEVLITPIMKIRQRKVKEPGFTNDLCGGLPFFPSRQNNKQWIAVFDAPDLLEKIDIEKLKKSDVILPEKRNELVRIIENLNEDDNPVLMIVTLK